MDASVRSDIQQLICNISAAFIGKEDVVSQAVLTLIAGGHVLIEDVPGLGKTLMAKAISRSVSADVKASDTRRYFSAASRSLPACAASDCG